ncbi:Translocation protein SEC62 [Thelohanellus kitauei]|uniref:Translocation protein SEC62 n=1 Tax=Thelohanellus kitauei TaxID=669202 RepID=A0A0C2JMJ8_THEKT|nr:Translocation protein SEC62 [Thelohanellus kitauei]
MSGRYNRKKPVQIELAKNEKSMLDKLKKSCPIKKGLLEKQKVAHFRGSDAFDSIKNIATDLKDHDILKLMTKFMVSGYFMPVSKYTTPVKQKKNNEKSSTSQKKFIVNLSPLELTEFSPSEIQYYAWLYEPITYYQYLICLGVALAVIGYYLKPFWPSTLEMGVSYISIAMVVLLCIFVGIALFRYVVFITVFLCSGGKVYFWYLPSLTKDCGVLESFQPLYSIDYYQEKQKEE